MKNLLALPLLALSLSQPAFARGGGGGVTRSLRQAVQTVRIEQRIEELGRQLENARLVPVEVEAMMVLMDLPNLPSDPDKEAVLALLTEDLIKYRAKLQDARMSVSDLEARRRSWPEGGVEKLDRQLYIARLNEGLLEARVADRELDLQDMDRIFRAGESDGLDHGIKTRKIALMERELAFLKASLKLTKGEDPRP